MTVTYRAQQCSWCGHPLHPDDCPKHITTGPKTPDRPCPCTRKEQP